MSRRTPPRPGKLNTFMLGVAALILIAFVGLSYRQWQQYRRANLDAQHSRRTLTAVDNLLAALTDAETGQRGFLLTGEDRYLEPYDRAVQEIPGDLSDLKDLLRSNPRQSQEFDQLNTLANTKLDGLRQTIDVRRTQGPKAALAIVLTNEGKRTMDAIRVLCSRMQSDETLNQARASADGEAAAGMALLLTVAGSLLALFLFAFGLEPFASPEPLAWQRSSFMRYGAALLGVAAVTLIRAALTPLIGPTEMPFTLYFCAVAFAAWFGGFRPAVFSIAASLLAGAWFFAEPTHSFYVGRHDDQTAMLMMILVGFGIALLSRSQRTAVERAALAETSERIARQRFETTLASIGDAVIATDADGRITFLNKIASALLQWPQDEARGKHLDEVFRIVNELTQQPVESPAARALRDKEIVALANRSVLIARDGAQIPIDDSAAPIRGSDGSIQGTVLVFRDVTERRRSETQLTRQALLLEQAVAEARAQRHRLGLALTAGKMGVYEIDLLAQTIWWSPETYALFGVSPADFKPARDSFAALIHPKDRQTFMQYWDENVAGFQPINHEFRILKPGGKEHWISCRGTPRYDDAGAPIHYSGLFLDVTERKEAETVLRKFEKLSAAARLSAAIAHEINNPLGAVTNLIYLAKSAPGVPSSISELLILAEHELERLAHAARQALGFYRETSRAESIDIPDLIESVLKVYSSKLSEKKISVTRSFLRCAPVYAVRGEVRQVVSNLLANAIEAVSDGGAISLEARPAGSAEKPTVEIVIADDGHGIAPQHLEQIFEPFFTTKAGTGTGLGLWVAKEIVERHQGSIAVHPTPQNGEPHGATFVVTLPGHPTHAISKDLEPDASTSTTHPA